MALTRKRHKALQRLRGNAEDLWIDQQVILGRANTIAREAKKQLSALAKEEVTPRLKTAIEDFTPMVTRNVSAARIAADTIRSRLSSEIIPTLTEALGSAAHVLHRAKNSKINAPSLKKRSFASNKTGFYFALSAGVVAAVGVGYAIWQTFRADDELWVSENDVETVHDTAE